MRRQGEAGQWQFEQEDAASFSVQSTITGESVAMNDGQPTSPRRRMQELLAIPDNRKTEEEWDELNELEISLAPVNQLVDPDKRQRSFVPSGAPDNAPGGRSLPKGRKPVSRPHRRVPRPTTTTPSS
jgi:hypothetical protein